MKLNRILIMLLFISTGCKKDIDHIVPDCIQDKIELHSKGDTCEEPGGVALWVFQDEFVYVFSPGDCLIDASSSVYNESCELIGSLGGWVGNKINGVNFYETGDFQKFLFP